MASIPSDRSAGLLRVLQEACAGHAVLVMDADGVVLASSAEAQRRTGYPPDEIVGRHLADFYTPGDVSESVPESVIREAIRQGVCRLDSWRRRKDGSSYPVAVLLVRTQDERGRPTGLVEFSRDLAEPEGLLGRLRHDVAVSDLLMHVAETCNEATSLREALRSTIPILCRHLGWPVGHAFGVSARGVIRSLDVWHVADEARFGWFRRVTEDTPRCPGDCVVADAVRTGRAMWIADPAGEPRFLRRPPDGAALGGGIVFPVRSDSRVVAVLECYADAPGSPDPRLSSLMETVGHQLGLVYLRARVTRALRRSEARHAGILHRSAETIVTVDRQQRIVLFNRTAQSTFGYRAAEILDEPLATLLPEDERGRIPTWIPGDGHPAEASHPPLVDLHFRRSDGSEFPAEVSVSTWQSNDGVLHTLVLRDVTKRWRAERDLRALSESGAVFAHALDLEEMIAGVAALIRAHLADVGLVLLHDDVDSRTWLFRAEEPGRVDRFEVSSRGDPPPSPLLTLMRGGRWVLDGGGADGHLTLPPPVDPSVGLEPLAASSWLLAPIRHGARCIGVLGLVSRRPGRAYEADDLTVAEELARRTALAVDAVDLYRAAARARRIQDEVLAMVAHDLGRPASSVAMVLDRLLKYPRAQERRMQSRGYLEGMRRSAEQMKRLIKDLLDVRRIETGRFTVEARRRSLRPIVEAVVEQLRLAEEGTDVELVVDVAPEVEACADPERVVQLLGNLLSNALRFSPSGGTIVIRARREGRSTVVSVEDEGPGIPVDQQPFLFDRFAPGRRPRTHGTGLGLTIASEIAIAHGGRIWVDSEVGKGSTFSFSLPDREDMEESRDP